MKKTIEKYLIIIFVSSLYILNGCKKDDQISLPVVATLPVTDITGTTATSGGVISSTQLMIARGVCWSTNKMPTISDNKTVDGSDSGNYLSSLSGLNAATTYYLRAYATSSEGTGYGEQFSFTTLGQIPICLTLPATNLSMTSATFNCGINSKYLSTAVSFEYGLSTSYGSTVSVSPNPDSEKDTLLYVSADLSSLTPDVLYHFRAKAVNTLGTTYGDDMTFKILSGTVTDGEGNLYNTVQIGTQLWMKENLRTVKYNDGTAMQYFKWSVTSYPSTVWAGDFSNYNEDINNSNIYGRLYTWYVASQNVCPKGWHIPSDNDWNTLVAFVGGDPGQLKETGLAHWIATDSNVSNASGFTALPGGKNTWDAVTCKFSYALIGQEGYWWSSSSNLFYAGGFSLSFNGPQVKMMYSSKFLGMSIRCLKD